MRKLKLQMNFAGINWDDEMINFCIDNLSNVDSILLGRITAEGFIPYWAEVARNPDPNDINSKLGNPLTELPKVVFSNSVQTNNWDNTTIIKGDIAEEIKRLKEKEGADIIVYGGNTFVSSLVDNELIDEFYLLVNPLGISNDEPILKFINGDLKLTLKDCRPFPSGTVLLHYIR